MGGIVAIFRYQSILSVYILMMMKCQLNTDRRASEMVSWVKMPAVKAQELSSNSSMCRVEEKNLLLLVCMSVSVYAYMANPHLFL